MTNAQKITAAWLQDPNGRGIAFDGSGLVSRNVYLDDVTKAMLLQAFHDAVENERLACAQIAARYEGGAQPGLTISRAILARGNA